eukprot:scaffold14958_cov79-Phaeocystis_antarctica.AAC.10
MGIRGLGSCGNKGCVPRTRRVRDDFDLLNAGEWALLCDTVSAGVHAFATLQARPRRAGKGPSAAGMVQN